jgi:hypothetical protein
MREPKTGQQRSGRKFGGYFAGDLLLGSNCTSPGYSTTSAIGSASSLVLMSPPVPTLT